MQLPSVGLTFDIEIHRFADVSTHVVADSTQVKAAVFLQNMLDEQRAIDQHLDAKARVEGDGFKLRDTRTWERGRNSLINQFIFTLSFYNPNSDDLLTATYNKTVNFKITLKYI